MENGCRLINLQIEVVLVDQDVLARPVYNQRGCLLLNKGATISRENKRQLSNHGVKEVFVTSTKREALLC